ncbi:MAG: gluconate 5-dehydrogenase [Spirochaetes bacterium]|nr:MAG: gluconate 5-dehydrogenase [Spirochaetota bacterium]RKX78507.1 MAG: gluconate 5-dehydrogenase [Spirochaetota bacterium]RKX98633.1 MAG: gluconate 5-dehydrogenase [Spirochaetota bacterium]
MNNSPENTGMFNLKNRVIFVAGGAGYLALPACRALLEQGARIAIGDFNKENLKAAIEVLGSEFPVNSILGLDFNIAEEESIANAIEEILEKFGRLDCLVNATYRNIGKSVKDLTSAEFNQANSINITGTFLLVRAAAEAMENGGSIILFSSMYGLISPNQSDYPGRMEKNPVEYGAGKAAINQLARFMAGEYGRQNIRVNAIAPGPFPWESVQKEHPVFMEKLSAKTMLGRIGRRDELAGTVVYLASDASSYMTGQVLSVDGGVTAW